MPYDDKVAYLGFNNKEDGSSSCGCSTDNCGCCPVGTVSVVDDCGNNLGCLTPNDAEIYNNSLINPIEGHVKTFHPTSGAYLGSMSVTDSIDLLNYLSNAVVPSSDGNDFVILSPVVLPSGFVDITYALVDGITADIDLDVDRIGVSEAIILSITDSAEDIQFDPSGTTGMIASGSSSETVKFIWTGIAGVGTYNFTLNFVTNGVSKSVIFRLTLT